jgi:hypothetical protein
MEGAAVASWREVLLLYGEAFRIFPRVDRFLASPSFSGALIESHCPAL